MPEIDITVDGNLTDVTTPTSAMRFLIIDSGTLKDVTFANLDAAITDTAAWEVHVQGSTTTNPTDSTTYYFGAFSTGWQTTIGNTKIRVPRTGTLASASLLMVAGGTGSAETSTVSFRLNDTTDTTISNAVDLSSSPFEVVNVALGVAVTAGDWFTVKWVTPAWVTNPTSVSLSCRLFFTA